jgi:lipopolysaccharide/colanic/teichoic acid biosynthesis glycosyltransferase
MKQNFSTLSSRRQRNRASRRDVPSAIRSIAIEPPQLWSDVNDSHDEASHFFPAWKRCLDFLAIMISMPLWLPLMLIGVIVVKAVSRGPVFFRQERVGLGGQRFMILKFRTMHFNADTSGHENYFEKLIKSDRPMTKLDAVGDKRLIRGGRLLRATALDELPQLFNVLRGEMSLVGPRPCTPAEMAHYDERQMERFNCPPGLTGFWQVNGKNKTTFSEMIDMDVRYSREMSAWGDIRIMFKTFPVLLEQVAELRKKRALDRYNQSHRLPETNNP